LAGWIGGWLEFLSEVGTERAIVDGATNLEQQIGNASRSRICCDSLIRRFTRKLAVPSVIADPTVNTARWRARSPEAIGRVDLHYHSCLPHALRADVHQPTIQATRPPSVKE
jgi:hypothetical protein